MPRPVRVLFVLLVAAGAGCPTVGTPPPPAPSVIALFDPTAVPLVVPQPTDLAYQGGDQVHLNVPLDPTAPPAAQDFIKYLNSLDGFPGTLDAQTTFSAPLSPASATSGAATQPGSVAVIDRDRNVLLAPNEYNVHLSAGGKTLIVTPARRWRSGGHYAVAAFGGSDASGLKGANGEIVLASPTFFFLRSDKPLAVACGDGTQPSCACPLDVLMKGDPNATTCHPAVLGLDLATAERAELLRLQLFASAVSQVVTLTAPRKRSDLALVWTFTITSAPMAMFDPARSDVPFPNDALINQTTHLVNVPIGMGDPMAPIKMQLNQLDGFSTTAAETLSIDTADGLAPVAASVTKGAQLVNVTLATISEQPTWIAKPVLVNQGTEYAGQIAVQSKGALIPDQNRYAVVVTSDVTDSMGRPLVPSPPMVLLKSASPLFDGTHSTVPALLDDSTASQLETLRLAYQPLFGLLASSNVPKDKIAMAWTFTTQSVARPLNALVSYPTIAALPTDVTITHVADAPAIATASLNYPTTHLAAVVFGSFQSKDVIDHAAGHIAFDRMVNDPMDLSQDAFSVHPPAGAPATPIKFTLTLPAGVVKPPVAILQHGLTQWRGQTIVLADAFAANGWATIAFDVNYHGARTVCSDDTQCSGTCNKTTGQCSGGFKPDPADLYGCSLQALNPGDPDGCKPAASGNLFLNPAAFFESRDNLRQYVTDASQLVRVLGDRTNPNGILKQLQVKLPTQDLDGANLAYLGQSLGAILGTLFLSVTPSPTVGYLSTVGGHDFEELGAGEFHGIVDQFLLTAGIMKDTAAYFQLVQTARWILDPADPFAVARTLIRAPVTPYLTGAATNAPKILLQQEAGLDTVIPSSFQEDLAVEIFGPMGVDAMHHLQSPTKAGMFSSTYWPTAQHGSLFYPMPSAQLTTDLQTNAATWVSSGGATITPAH